MANELRKIPKLEELYADVDTQKNVSELAILLNQPPKEDWLKEHPYAKTEMPDGKKVKAKFIPIARLEFLMTYIFSDWYVEIKETKLLANSLVVTVRVHYKRPFIPSDADEWRWTDGVGAVPIQIKADTGGAIDFQNMNSTAVQIGLPAAESYAFKDAVEKLGKIFGKDLNRKDILDYSYILGAKDEDRFKSIPIGDVTAPLLGEGSKPPIPQTNGQKPEVRIGTSEEERMKLFPEEYKNG